MAPAGSSRHLRRQRRWLIAGHRGGWPRSPPCANTPGTSRALDGTDDSPRFASGSQAEFSGAPPRAGRVLTGRRCKPSSSPPGTHRGAACGRSRWCSWVSTGPAAGGQWSATALQLAVGPLGSPDRRWLGIGLALGVAPSRGDDRAAPAHRAATGPTTTAGTRAARRCHRATRSGPPPSTPPLPPDSRSPLPPTPLPPRRCRHRVQPRPRLVVDELAVAEQPSVMLGRLGRSGTRWPPPAGDHRLRRRPRPALRGRRRGAAASRVSCSADWAGPRKSWPPTSGVIPTTATPRPRPARRRSPGALDNTGVVARAGPRKSWPPTSR